MVVGLTLFCCVLLLIKQGDYGWAMFFLIPMLWALVGQTWRIPPRF